MPKIAIIKTGGKQYKVKKGQNIKIEKLIAKDGLPVQAGVKVKFDTLLTASTDGKEINLGKPSLGEKVEAKIIEQGRAKKITVVKYKNKIRYKRTLGHKQPFTQVEITGIAN
ncbi:50S ribosomal protein L21 [Candidatus Parcubacteria bacterium]|nr:50S ribosomal protein L21 [Candidatus Parcubacteria bacterium]